MTDEQSFVRNPNAPVEGETVDPSRFSPGWADGDRPASELEAELLAAEKLTYVSERKFWERTWAWRGEEPLLFWLVTTLIGLFLGVMCLGLWLYPVDG